MSDCNTIHHKDTCSRLCLTRKLTPIPNTRPFKYYSGLRELVGTNSCLSLGRVTRLDVFAMCFLTISCSCFLLKCKWKYVEGCASSPPWCTSRSWLTVCAAPIRKHSHRSRFRITDADVFAITTSRIKIYTTTAFRCRDLYYSADQGQKHCH